MPYPRSLLQSLISESVPSPDAPRAGTSFDVKRPDTFDVCVIGTGAGGGTMIRELTAAGFRVVALQRGPYLRNQDFVSDDELTTARLFSPDQIETWRPDENSPEERGRFNYVAHCVGGTMTIWGAWNWQISAQVPQARQRSSSTSATAGSRRTLW